MIDEKILIRKIQKLIDETPEDTQEKAFECMLYRVILELINRQPVISPARIRFEQRMGAVLMAMGKMNVVELTDFQEVLL